MDAVKRLAVRTMPAKGKLTESAAKIAEANATIHVVNRTTGVTLCGKDVPKKDKRWVGMRSVSVSAITCVRCLAKMKGSAPSSKPSRKKNSEAVRAGATVSTGSGIASKKKAPKITRVPHEDASPEDDDPAIGIAFASMSAQMRGA